MKEGSRNGASLSEGGFMRGAWREGSCLGTPKDVLSKALEWASVSIAAQLSGNMEGRAFLRAFEINRYIKRYVKMSCKRVCLSIGPRWGTWRGFACRNFFREKDSISGFLSDPEDTEFLSLVAIWNFVKGTGLC
jgi:hypothetical protein